MQENMYGVSQYDWLRMTEGDRQQYNQLVAGSGRQPNPTVDPTTLPDYRPDMVYDNYGTIAYAAGPHGGAPSGGPNVGYGAVGPPNSGGGAGYVGSGYGYTPAGPPVASVGTIADRGRGIYADAAMYRGGDFAGAGSGDGFGGGGTGPTENIQGSPVADLSLSNYTPGSDQNTTPYDNYGSQWEDLGGGSWIDRMTGDMHDLNYGFGNDIGGGGTYSGGGIGSDAGATRGRIADYIARSGGGPTMNVYPQQYPSTPFGGGFNNRAPTYNNAPEFNQSGTGWNIPSSLSGFPPTPPLYLENIPGATQGMPFYDPNNQGSPYQPGG